MKAKLKPKEHYSEDCRDPHCEICQPAPKGKVDHHRQVDEMRRKVLQLVGEKPEKAALIISEWIKK